MANGEESGKRMSVVARATMKLLIDNEVETSLEDFIAANETLTAADVVELKDLEIGDSMLFGLERVVRTA